VLGFAQVLLRAPDLTAEQREQVNMLHDAGRHLLELVNSLLDLSKIEAGKLDLHLRHIALRPLLEACAGLLAPEVARKGMSFTLEIAPGTPEAVEADATRVRQMLLNLLSNAVKFTPAGGCVVLRASSLPSDQTGENAGIRIELEEIARGAKEEKFQPAMADLAASSQGIKLGVQVELRRLACHEGGQQRIRVAIGTDDHASQREVRTQVAEHPCKLLRLVVRLHQERQVCVGVARRRKHLGLALCRHTSTSLPLRADFARASSTRSSFTDSSGFGYASRFSATQAAKSSSMCTIWFSPGDSTISIA